MASRSDQVAMAKHHAGRSPSNITFKGAVERVMMANSFGYSFKSARQKRVEGTLFHDKFKNRKRLTHANTPEALSHRLTELDEALVVKRKQEKENARRAREAMIRERKFQVLQSKKHAVMLFQQPLAGKMAMKLASKAHRQRAHKVAPVDKPLKATSPKVIPKTHVKKAPPLVIAVPPDPLTRWRSKTVQRMTGEAVDDQSSVSSHASKISFATAADAVESVETERKALHGCSDSRRPSRNRLLDRLKQTNKPSTDRVKMDKLEAAARQVRGLHQGISMWSEVRDIYSLSIYTHLLSICSQSIRCIDAR